MRRGEITFATLVGAIIAILVLLILGYILYNSAQGFQKDVEECRGGYCAPNCLVMTSAGVAGSAVGNDEWCELGLWDLTDEQAAEFQKQGAQTKVPGSSLGLQCCALFVSEQNKPITYLSRAQRTGETDYISGITSPPRIQLYFDGRPNALGINSETDIVGGRPYTFDMKVYNLVEVRRGVYKAKVTDRDDEEIPEVTCKLALLNGDGDNLFSLTDGKGYTPAFVQSMKALQNEFEPLCTLATSESTTYVQSDIVISAFPESLEGETVELVVTFSENEGQYNSFSLYETQAKFRFTVNDDIKVSGMTNEWTRSRALTAECVDDDCFQYNYSVIQKPGDGCSYDKQATVKNGRGTIVVDEFEGDNYACILAISRSGRIYTTITDVPVRIDRTPPSIDVSYNPIFNVLTIRCSEDPNSGSGCAVGAGVHEITGITEFFLGDCAEAKYSWLPGKRDGDDTVTEIEYKRVASVSRYCIEGQDRAGNKAHESEFAYDARTIAAATIAGWLASR